MGTIDKAIDKLQQKAAEAAPAQTTPARAGTLAPAAPIVDEPPLHGVIADDDAPSMGLADDGESGNYTRRHFDIDLERLDQARMLTPAAVNTRLAGEFRSIKRPLLKNAFGKGVTPIDKGNMIMVTSAYPGEGKTYVTLNLAMSIASERDTTVMLVDADVVKPSISSILRMSSEPGLVDYLLSDELELADVLVKTNVPTLTILPAGRRHTHATELLHSDAMAALMREMSERYSDRIVLFDSPPLLATSEAAVLASMMGQVIVVVEAEKTTQAAVKEALSVLDPTLHVSFILNKSRRSHRAGYYGSYGYYGN